MASSRTTRVTIRMPNDLLSEIEDAARRHGTSVAAVLITGARRLLAADAAPEPIPMGRPERAETAPS